jgi:hypothetical protein
MKKNNHYPIPNILIRSIGLLVFIAILFSLFSGHALAQDYSFRLDSETVHVYWNADGTMAIDYVFVFSNDSGASAIDFVDVGLPNNNYTIANIRAEIDGVPITDIQDSPYVTYGVALGLGANAIPAGSTGTVHVFVDKIENPYYIDYNDDNYASFQFSPTWFGSEFVSGESHISMTFHLPPGVSATEPRWHGAPSGFPEEPETGLDEDGRIFYTWQNPNANGHTQYIFGASIPRQYVLATFWLESETHHIYLNADGSVDVDNEYTFTNQSQGASLSNLAVDIPYRAFEIINPLADVNGIPVQDLYADYSIMNLELGDTAIRPGATDTIHLAYTLVDQPYTSSWWDEEYTFASFEYRTTDFDATWTAGMTDFSAIVHLPAGISSQDIDWKQDSSFSVEPSQNVDSQGRTTLTWQKTDAAASDTYSFIIHIPRENIAAEAVYEYAKPGLLTRMGIDEDVFYGCLCMSGFTALVGGVIALSVRSTRKRKMKYLPPKMRIEGHGIKRGLTAVEAAILMEHPADKVMTMILFAVLKKDAASVVTRDPLKVEVTQPIDEKLRYYERDFLAAFAENSNRDRKRKLQDLMVKLIKNVGKRMKGFSHKETVVYYKSIMRKAWTQIEQADTPEVRSQQYDEHMGWTMLDRDFDQRTEDAFRGRPVFVPMWWHRYDPSWSRSSSTPGRPATAKPTAPAPTPGTGRAAPSMPNLPGGEFAASMVTGMQGFAGDVVGNVSSFTDRITNKTNPVPKSTSSGRSWSGGSGGSSCACACACAGCACACAGGGR